MFGMKKGNQNMYSGQKVEFVTLVLPLQVHILKSIFQKHRKNGESCPTQVTWKVKLKCLI